MMMFAYLFMNYDVRSLGERRGAWWFGRNLVPDVEACVEVRRRGVGD